MSFQPTRVYQTHFGPVQDLERLARDLHAAIVESVRIARAMRPRPDRRALIEAELFPLLQRAPRRARLHRRPRRASSHARRRRAPEHRRTRGVARPQLKARQHFLLPPTPDHGSLSMTTFRAFPHPRSRPQDRRALRPGHARRPLRRRRRRCASAAPTSITRTHWRRPAAGRILRKYPLWAHRLCRRGRELDGRALHARPEVLVTGCGLSETHDGGLRRICARQRRLGDSAARG